MSKKCPLPLLLVAVFSFSFATLADPVQDTAEMIRHNNAMLGKYSRSLVEVEYFFDIAKQSETPGLKVRYFCPDCKTYHWREVESLISSRQSQGVPGFVVGPDRILSVDMQLRQDWLERIEVISEGRRRPAKIIRYYPQHRAVELQVSGLDSTSLSPISFTDQPQGRLSYFFLIKENGIRIAGCRPEESGSIRKNLDRGIDYRVMLPNSLVIDSRGEAVTLSFQERVALTQERFLSPQQWPSLESAARDRQLAERQSHLSQNLFPVTFLLREEKGNKVQRYRYYRGDSDEDELFTVGTLLPDGRLLCNLLLTEVQTARLEKILLHLPDGRSISAAFVGSLKDWGGIVVAPDEKLPGSGLTFSSQTIAAFCDQPAISVFAQNFGNVLKLHLVPTILDLFTLGFENMVIAEPQNYDCEKSLLLSQAGEVLQYSLERRGGANRYNRDFVPVAGNYVAGLLSAAEPFDLQNIPKSADELTRYAWLGVEMQELTAQLARIHNAAGYSKDGNIGVLLNKVLPDSPAAKAGLQVGDILLYLRTIDGNTRTNLDSEYCEDESYFGSGFPWDDYDQLPERFFSEISAPWPPAVNAFTRLLSKIGIGKTAVFGRISNGELSEISIQLEESPPYFTVAPRYTASDFGFTVAEITYEVRDYFRLEAGSPGLIISNIVPGSTASVSGLKPYEIILTVDNQPVHNLLEFENAIRDKTGFSLLVRRLTTNRIVKVQAQAKAAAGTEAP